MKNLLIFAILAFLTFSGCSTKRQYFEPFDNNITGDIDFGGSLPSAIKYATVSGATLKNGMIISNSGLNENIKLNKDEIFLGEFDGKFVASNKTEVRVLDSDNSVILQRVLDKEILSAAIYGDKLALLSGDNSAYLIDISSNTVQMQEKLGNIYAIDSRVASPVFLNDIVIFPTLDGKLSIANTQANRMVRDILISSEPFFNNVIMLKVLNNGVMYAATSTKLVAISTNGTKTYDTEVRNVLFADDKIYLFSKDGEVHLLDINLNKIKTKKFTFAVISAAAVDGDSLYMFERSGYLIKTNLALDDEKIYKISGDINNKVFTTKTAFYHDDEFLKF